jgi:hypothetical protein
MRGHRADDRWIHLKPLVRQQWASLTDDDIDSVRGNLERLVDVLQVRHNYNRMHAEREIARWRRELVDGHPLPRA